MTKKLVRHGNSMALIIEKPILNILKINQDSNIDVTIENGALVIRAIETKAAQNKTREQEIEEIVNRVMERYDDAFKRLAKT